MTRGSLRCGDRTLAIGTRTFVMGIVNVTPDSFSDGGAHASVDDAVAHAMRLLEDGADVLDIGGESTRPGAELVPVDVERGRVLPVIEALAARGVRNLSIDTRNAATAKDALAAGASWVNDVSALRHDEAMREAAAAADAVVLMHAREMTQGHEDAVRYGDVVGEVHAFLVERIGSSGLAREKIVVDPGIGFGKRAQDNVELMRSLARFAGLGAVLVGPSRKRFLGTIAGVERAEERDAATHGAVAFAALHGADLVRVHDVKGAVHALRVVDALARR